MPSLLHNPGPGGDTEIGGTREDAQAIRRRVEVDRRRCADAHGRHDIECRCSSQWINPVEREKGVTGLFLTCAGDTLFRRAAETHPDIAALIAPPIAPSE